jgi:hypothetical protein
MAKPLSRSHPWRRVCAASKAWLLGVLALAVLGASANPLVNPQDLQWVCSADGTLRWVAPADTASDDTLASVDANPAQGMGHGLECVLCLGSAPPLEPAHWSAPLPESGGLAKDGVTNERAEPAPSQFPARGPPLQA